ncbi:hypothetical protein LJR168_003913 [Pseudoxanthomonas sp. LjRoot168]|uniref:hypothetical protein n=1 Tax=unclassified Pseudoxanthomonas TaxID=2645906 RepID=UPI003ECE15B0
MKTHFNGPNYQRGESFLWMFIGIMLLLLIWGAVDSANKSRDAQDLLLQLSMPAIDRSENLDPAFYRLAEAALAHESVQAPVGAWTIQQDDKKLSVEQLLVLHRDHRFSVLSRTTIKNKEKDGAVGRVSDAKGTYQVKGAVLNLSATTGSPAWNGPYIIESMDQTTMALRHQASDVITYRAVTAAEVPAMVAKLKDERSDSEIASSDAAAKFADKLHQSGPAAE